jgi:hypothetical protein
MAEDCRSSWFFERLLWRKLTLGIRFSEAGNDPEPTLRNFLTGAIFGQTLPYTGDQRTANSYWKEDIDT